VSDAPKVLVTVYHLTAREAPYLRRLERAGFEVVRNPLGRHYTESELVAALPGVFGTLAGGEPYTERVFQAARDLRIVARFGVGYDMIDVDAATRHGVAIAMAFGANHEAVADFTLALMIGLATNLVAHHQRAKSGGWGCGFHAAFWGTTVGVVGLGRIGRAVARRCQGFGMRVLAHDIQPDAAYAREHAIELVPLDTLLRESDFVTLHAPHIKETENLIGRRQLAQMKATAYLVNTARGALVDEEALYEVLAAGRIAGAGLDVFTQEPPTGSPLLTLDNVLLAPHAAGMNVTAEAAMANRCIDSILALARGEHPGDAYVLNTAALALGRPDAATPRG
jgi:D-3-phosphoglycerate dehydrogenase / 2-oxoglutarate reductase